MQKIILIVTLMRVMGSRLVGKRHGGRQAMLSALTVEDGTTSRIDCMLRGWKLGKPDSSTNTGVTRDEAPCG